MGINYFLLCVAILKATAVSGCPIGREFITAFMPNYKGNDGQAEPKLIITAQESLATVTIEMKGLNFKQSITIEKGSTTYVTLPSKAEIYEDGVSAKTVVVTSSTDISVVSSHIKPFTGDISVIFPNHQLGKSYVAFTPEGGTLNQIVAIINGKEDNTINILPYSNLLLKSNIQLKRGLITAIRLAPYQVYLLRSEKTLTGTRIESLFPVAVLAGHECLALAQTCEHVYEQLMPIEMLSDEYLVPTMHPSLPGQDTAHVVATENDTKVTVYHGPLPQHKSLSSGELLNVVINLPTVIQSNKKIMVMYSSTNSPYDEFLTNIIPVSQMSNTWTVYTQDNYQNFVVVVSETKASKPLFGLLNLNVFPANQKYSWAVTSLGSQKGPITISKDSPQAVYVYGGQVRTGYGTTGVCTAPTSPPPPKDPCESVKCRWRQECRNGVCVPVDTATCWAVGDPHYKTFDGKRFDFQGTCTYTMVTTVKTEKGSVPFTIRAKNNRRGSNLVSYVRAVSLNVYNHTIVASKQIGVVEVDGEITYLPISLDEGKIEVVRSGSNALITTDFGLEVKYDWNMMLYITVPRNYFGSLGGLCGNYNGDGTDEQSDPKGTKLPTVLEFAKSWKVLDNDLFCRDDCEGKCLNCPPDHKEKYNGDNYCGLMAKTTGPFANCHKTVDPSVYLDNCVYDVCINKGIRSLLCENMRTYAEACMSAGVKIDSNWRMLTECPLPCPANSHYKPCGTACAASCADRDAPSKCEKPCVEGCQCNDGFVLSGDKCVPLAQCGCVYENRYYPSAETFWGDQTCTKKCSCTLGQVTCTPTKCKASETCSIQNGVRDCYPLSYGHCVGSGDPHYLTFDGKRFDFQGTCTYYLSKLVNTSDTSVVPYEVLVKNENRGMNKVVSYTKTVEINIFGYNIIMSKDSYRKVMVNNLFVNLPFEKEGGRLSIFHSGYFGVVKTNFGLNVRFNWESHVGITLPSTYSNLVGGLCGNWNGNVNDDLMFPNKSITTNPTAFGNGWKARDDPNCSAECKGQKCPKCDSHDMNKDIFTKPCSLITDANGPFKACHSQINPIKFYEDCVYDMCMYGGHFTALCSSLTAYMAACQTAHSTVEKWRTDSFCPSSCKANSHYDVCGAGCPQTCNGFSEPTTCQRAPCIEGCVCDDGFVLSNGECVPVEQCGCTYEGQYYNLGQVFYPKVKCSQMCVCNEQGKVTCKDNFLCGPNEKCEIRDGVQSCHPEGKGSCSVSGSGTYHSYDGNRISVPGDCTYKLVETVPTVDQKKMPFSVTVQQVSSTVVVTRRIDIVVNRYKIALIPGLLWEIRVDEVKALLPVTLEEGLVKAYQSGAFIIVETSFGLKVTYDTVSMATVEIPSTYKNAVQGLCGNYNDKKTDDLLMPNGNQASSAEKFVEAWLVVQKGIVCYTGCPPGSICPGPETGEQNEEDNDCKILTLEKGPFSNCYSTIPPLPYYDTCVNDVASQTEDKTLVCRHIQNYVVRCQQAGVTVSSWRNATFCPMNCSEKSHYELCADTCTSTCASLSAAPSCTECLEGCQCDEGFVFDGGECKLVNDCGCLVDGRYYKSGESVTRGDCTERCNCKAGQFSCQLMKCKDNEVCRRPDGIPTCMSAITPPPPPKDPCESVKCRRGQECRKGVCVPVETATCWAVGDPHYKTFDGKRYDFQGTCTYTMVTTIKTENGRIPFTILAKNNHRGNNLVSYVRTVSLTVYNHTIVASKQIGVVEVDGEITRLPVRLDKGKIEVVQSGWNALITTDFGLEVKYDWNMMLYITVPKTYFRSLGGLCGNYNGDGTDEQSDPKGTKLPTVLEFAKSWKVLDNDLFCHDDCGGKCLNCPPDHKEKYNGDNYCGLMAKTTGPFANCHKTVDPSAYIDNCVYDVCINKGIRSFLCENMRAYAEACMAAGVKIDSNWRMLSECPLQCPVNSHYEPCGTACAASCADRDAPSKCEKPCVEGCQCNAGFVLSGDKCVPLAQCGCIHKNRYYPSGETFWGDQTCTNKCSCTLGQVTCTPTKCKASEVCSIQNGVRDCYPLSYGHCVGSGDPHYLTFDGKRFDFQGTCTYYLSKLVNTSDTSVVPYEVLVKNENRGMNKVVSYTKTVEINIFGYNIIMSKDSYRKVMVNNLFVNLPFEKEGGRLSIFRSGYFGVVKTNFGLNVRYNWESHVGITIPSTYSNLVGGLCGNWNGNVNDDLMFPNKSITTNPTAFGNGWKARDDPNCSAECKGQKCPKCDSHDMNKDVFTKPCSLITDANGPFKACHRQIDPTKFYEDCVYDMCMYGGHFTALCSSLTAYTAACQTAHSTVEKWRTENFCPSSCKANSHYDVCGAGCPQTCNGFSETTTCQRAPCIEGCVCDDGFVLSNGDCVPMEQCGCTYEGQYYNLGQVFYPNRTCSQICVCNEQEKVTCKDNISCGPNEKCKIRDGVQSCHPDGKGSCSVSGSGTYHSYDGNRISVPGDCTYKLVETVPTADQKKMPFSVTVQQVSSTIVVTRRIDIVVNQYKIALIPGLLWEIRVDKVKALLPVTLEEGLVKAYQIGAFIIVETSFGLKVTYDTVSMATVEIPSTYKNAVQGLCGNYNDNKTDDLLMPNGNQASSAEKFVEAWLVVQKGIVCYTGCPPGSICPGPETGEQNEEDNDCKILTLEKGPFSNCYSTVPPLPYYDTCVNDVASQTEDKTLVCRHVQNYVVRCQQAGVTVSSWRNATFCPMTCPEKSHYELCADTCTSTCASLSTAPGCTECLEGCQCDEGFVFDGGECKLVNDCGCLVDGRYYKSGESVTIGDCTERCNCKAGQFSCQPMKCKDNEVCRRPDGIPTCMSAITPSPPPKDPCESVKCRRGQECRKGVCVPVETATCWAVGDPHYKTFDGKRYDFQGTCTYTMVTTIKTENGRIPFTILAKNNHRGNNLVSYVRTVSLTVYNHTIVASKQIGVVEVDGENTRLPVRLDKGKIIVVQSGWNALITTDFGLEVKYDWNMMLYITVPRNYFGSLGGLCGNYNGDGTDEQSDPKGTKLSTVLEFAKSWKVLDNDLFCHDDCGGKCLNCPPDHKEKYNGDNYCGLMAKTTGPFANCLKTVDPSAYIDNCVYDVCINKGIRSFLCENIRTYAEACMAAGVKIDSNWRMLSECPLQCPVNSHYEPCGTACAASCADRDAPSKCEKPCVEGCQCNAGFVLSGDKCVPLAQCGCIHKNRYYPSGEIFWGDQTCTNKCSCTLGQVTCTPTKCKASEVCSIQNGVRDCYPLSYGHCVGSGDPHYLTFDGKRFDFQGTCTYYLSKLVNTSDTSVVPYEVLVKNENRGMNKVVSYTKTVEINIFGYNIIMSKDSYRKVMVNNLFVNLPFEREGGRLSIFRSGYFGVVKTNFGLNVRFNWEGHVGITIPSTYSNLVGGLCGNWNGNVNDDLMFPNKSITTNPTAFGNGWKARDEPKCSAECKGQNCPKCDSHDMNKDIFTKPCSVITDANGPFKACHRQIDPIKFYEDCVYDMCMYGGHFTSLCSSLTAYTAACQIAHSMVEKWRTESFCPSSCKANSHYDVCGAGCPQTCNGFSETTTCQRAPCIEGCVCDDGFVLSDGDCVPMEQCGCTYEGQYYNLGQVFYPNGMCSQMCVCNEQEKVTCKDNFSCGPNEKCEIRDGVQSCHPDGKGSCSVSGSGTYHSYDGNRISVPGDCMYKLVETVPTAAQKKMPFSVTVQQVSSTVVVTRRIDIVVNQYKIALIPGLLWEIRVDKVKALLPVTLEGGLVKAYQSGAFIIVETSFGLKVTYDTVSMATVEIPSTYKNAVQGLCGNYNNNKTDDLLMPNGNQASSAEKFVEAWLVVQKGIVCYTGCPPGSICAGPETGEQNEEDNDCKILTLEKGPFSNCYSTIPPLPYYDTCVNDVASQTEDKTLVCRHIQNYVVRCQQAGVTVSSWRNATFCPMTCPEKSHYELCADTCTSTCASLSTAPGCTECLEGCQCDEGFVFDGGECKLVNDCGCLVDGRYYKSGESVTIGDCTERCNCKAGQFSCQPMKCKDNEVCRKPDGIPTCMSAITPSPPPKDPCESVKCRRGQECRKGVCVPVETATCWAVGDPHYKTFDGKRYDFQGTCTYTMVTTIKTENGRIPFTILAKNNHRGNNLVSYVRTVSLTVYNHTIVASKQIGVVEVDGENTRLPVRLDKGKIIVVQSGWNALITTDFGLEVKYDWNMMLYITVPRNYFGSLGGLCGNYNGDGTDEQSDPKGTKLSTVLEFAKSWKVLDNDLFCHDDCGGKCLHCPPDHKEKYNGDNYCGLMAKTTGPFANCHKTVDPSAYIDNCVYDVCINKGIRSFLCENIRTYAEACMAAGVKIDSNWRMLSECPLQCPVNSHYEPCGTACAASCADRDAPSKCEKPCVEGCQCNAGFVLSGDKCVPLAQCGCIHKNRYYPSGEIFWGDQTCTNKCSCTLGQVTCTPTKCKASEVCSIQNGVRDCYPLSYGHCVGSGDPHYLTFDGKRFDFQGTCTYYLSKLVNTSDTSVVPYEVLVKNENRGMNKVVSYTKTVEINIFGYNIIMSKDSYRKVMVNNLFVNLPFEREGGRLSIFRSGYFGVVKTNFGLNVRFNWESHVGITIPSTYSNLVGGLCGNWNGNVNDDLMFPNKSITTNPTAFGNGWKARDDPNCSAECNGQNCPKCDSHDMNKDIFTKPCSVITDANGPFKACHRQIDPTKFYEDCVYDMCMYGGHFTALCSSLTAYTAACQIAHSTVEKWRTDSFCPSSCKANSHYDVCGAGCPQTCNGFSETTTCQRASCIEGCVCDDGFVLSDGDCLPMEQCGCTYEGQYYNLGQVFYPNGTCNQMCVCNEQGKVTCKDNFSCGPNEKCEIRDGVQSCHPDGKGSCSVSGSGTYHSYDGNRISVPGDCMYKLVETVPTADQKKMPFSVTVQQVSSTVVVTRRIDIVVNQYKIALIPGLLWEIRVDKVKALLPVTLEGGLVKAYQSGAFIIVETSFGLKVTYDTVSMATVEIPSTYKNAVQGLCGNYNDNKTDDLLMPNGNQASSAEKFVEAWLVVQKGIVCYTGCPPGSICPGPETGEQNEEDNDCKILTLEKGPFSNCYSTIPPLPYYDTCVNDVASQTEDKTLVCRHIQNYMVRCQQAGVTVSSWRNATFCPMTCSEKSHYELCADTCTSTCASLSAAPGCTECLEGCQCDEGFVFDGGECKLVNDCGCLVDGRYYKSGESVTIGDCTERCNCKAGQFSCQPMKCKDNEVCRRPDGIPTCMSAITPSPPPKDPCESVKCHRGQECRNGVCVPVDTATCWAVGDPHYKTFDGKRYDFQGTCTYTMVTTIKTENGRIPFTILAKNNHRGNNLVSYVRTVSLTVYNHTIVASKQIGVVEVDGEITRLPVRLDKGKIEVVQSGWNALITTDFGLEVKYDWNMMLYITVPRTYFGSLGGLCGNYNGDGTDEQSDPKGTKLPTVLEFAKSWKVLDNDLFCHDDCGGKCLNCPPDHKEKYNGDNYCGLMAKTSGPFANCHKTVDPSAYIDNCVYDVCINKGIRSFLCENMRAYAEACMAAGVKIDSNWRMLSECPLQCPVNSHYEPCGTACAASCADRDAPSKCKKPCVEGCQCNDGFVLSGDKCVPLTQCGCIYKNRYYPSGETFWGDQTCTKKCSCTLGKVTCTPTKCKASEVCSIQNGVRDCYPLSYGHCVGSGDPHYLTFDGKRFDFQGTCTYYLSKLVNTSDTSVVPYEVLVKNENRGMNKVVSYTKTVEINIFGYKIIMSKDSYRKVMVNNLFVNLPFEREGGRLSIFRSGYFGVVKTNFGLNVRYNWESHVGITIPSTYSNLVGGLCGNWNGNVNDDLMFPNKSITSNPTAFGSSWKARDDPNCSAECEGPKCPKCDSHDMNKDIFTKPCSLITDANGPFKACHRQIDPTKFYEDCVYDMCMYGGHFTALCSSLTAYTAACQTAHSTVEKWRTESFCPASCKANSHYDVCGAGCPQTCNGFTEPTTCQRAPCIEGCVCDDGFVLSNGDCVPMEQCGCTYEGQYYNLGQVFYPNGTCSQMCVCNEQGQVTCKDNFSCGPNEKCEIRNGVQSCHPDGKGFCSVSGSGTYHSYDGNRISVPGDCTYKLVETVPTADQKKMPFSVTVQQVSSTVMVRRRIDIVVNQYKISMIPGLLWEIRVDEVKALLPVTLEEGLVKAYQNGAFIIVETSLGLKVTYDTVSMATVEIPSTYKNAVQGLCGNYNDNKTDDLLMPNGNQTSSAEKFVEAWLVVQEGAICYTGCPPGSTCPGPETRNLEDNDCKILTLEKGPFSNCYSTVPPLPYYNTCVNEIASQPKDKTLVCRHIQNYVVRCQQAGVTVSSWRNATFCPMTCSKKSHYEFCADTCTSTCASLTMAPVCPKCLEGCQCDEGFVFDGSECKLVNDCGCLVEGRYYKSGESVIRGNCTERCTCKAGSFSCQSINCKKDEVCHKLDGIPKCIRDVCSKKRCREKEQCVERNNTAVCVATSKASCRVFGDPHYKTFDGSRFSFQGTCSYIMVKTSGEDKSLTEFSIVNKHEQGIRGSYVKTATLKFLDYEITIIQHVRNKVIINGNESILPVSLDSDRIRITKLGLKGTLETDFGLEATFDWGQFFTVTVSSSYYKNLVGMCGTYNDNRDDDFVTPTGIAAKDNTEWGKSWSVPDNDPKCWHFPSCSEQLLTQYKGPKFCGLLEDMNGPFANCNNTVKKGQFTYNCLYNICLNQGNHDDFCNVMTTYAFICKLANTDVLPEWRQIAHCKVIL